MRLRGINATHNPHLFFSLFPGYCYYSRIFELQKKDEFLNFGTVSLKEAKTLIKKKYNDIWRKRTKSSYLYDPIRTLDQKQLTTIFMLRRRALQTKGQSL